MAKTLNSNDTGGRGELLFATKISKAFGRVRHFPVPVMLGEKHEALDYYVVIQGRKNAKVIPHCFVQVKATRPRAAKKGKNIKATLSKADVMKLLKIPAPTYLVAIDEKRDKGYIISVNELRKTGISSIKTTHSIDSEKTLKMWKEELRNFWSTNNNKLKIKSKLV